MCYNNIVVVLPAINGRGYRGVICMKDQHGQDFPICGERGCATELAHGWGRDSTHCFKCRTYRCEEHLTKVGTRGHNNYTWVCKNCVAQTRRVIKAQRGLCKIQGHNWPSNWDRKCVCKCCGKVAVFGTGSYDSEAAEQYHGT